MVFQYRIALETRDYQGGSKAERQGLQAARARGRKGGRPKSLKADKRAQAVHLYEDKKHTVMQIYQMMDISKPTLYKYIEAHGGDFNSKP